MLDGSLLLHRYHTSLVVCLAFLLHATCYLYFFVDDEGITLVYARSLLEGRGLTYAPSDGPSEGYSNFLHVLVMAAVLGLVSVTGLDPMWAFVAGGVWSLACGTMLVWLVWHLGARLDVSPMARTAAALVLALSGPLAVWSNSSLETVPFALAFLALITTTVPVIRPPAAIAAAIVVMLLRVDGALFVGVWLTARAMTGSAAERRTILRHVAPAVLVTAAVYGLGRAWYFGAWLSLPLQTKVAHKLIGSAGVVWTERGLYLFEFARRAGLPILLGLLALVVLVRDVNGRRRLLCATGLALAVLLGYVALVGDWMFGFRFMVPLLAPLALLIGFGLDVIERRRPSIARVAAAGAVGLALVSAAQFQSFYQSHQRKPVFWAALSLDPAKRFGEYHEAYEALKPMVEPGMRIAYHEAGFVPFLLGIENIDMLGLTSRFVGGVPTADAIFTDVGRYYPLTPEPPHHAVHAYLVYREPELIVVRNNWMRTANGGAVPGEILHGHYGIAKQTDTFVIYRRTNRAVNPRRQEARGFLENIAHPAYLEHVAVNGERIHSDTVEADLPSLWHGGSHPITIDPLWTLYIDPRDPSPVHEIYVDGSAPSESFRIEVRLITKRQGTSRPIEQIVPAGKPFRIQRLLESPHIPDAIDIRFISISGGPVRLRLNAVRVMGQTEALREHLERHGIGGSTPPP